MTASSRPGPRAVGATAAALIALAAGPAAAHVQELVPSHDLVTPHQRTVAFEIVFTHPGTGGPAMAMGAPERFGVLHNGEIRDLSDLLSPTEVDGAAAYDARVDLAAPGDHVFFIEPAPYFEASEDVYIQQFTKVVVEAFGREAGWDDMVGLPVEIRPLVRPYGLWAGNVFRGIVTAGGEPVPFAEIEVEYRNTDGLGYPADVFATQAIRADAHGAFSYAMPRAGWWGFAALDLVDGAEYDGKPLSQDAVIWVRSVDMP
jgi:cobalt/nickel transport protein